MAKAKTLVGLDVHATKIVAAVLDAETGQLQTFAMSGETATAAGFCAGLPRPVRVAYEAGPTGYGLARELAKRGVECVVAAPSKIPRASGDRVKTDRRDAEHLVRLLLAGKLHAVRVPGDEEEALRDLVRARDAVRMDLMRCRHRLSKLLLRHGIRFDDGHAWTQRHRDWLGTVTLDWPAAQATLLDARRDRRAGSSPRRVGARDRRDAAQLAVGGAGRPVALPARDRHALGGRAVRGDRRLRALRPRRAADELRRAGPVRARPASNDGSGRSPRPAPGTPGGCWWRPLGITARAQRSAVRSPTARTASRRQRSRSPGQRSDGCTAPGHASRRRTIIAVAAARELAGFVWAITQIE